MKRNVPFLAIIIHGITEEIILEMNGSSAVTFQNPSFTFSFTHEIKIERFCWTAVKSCDISWFYNQDKMVCKVVLNLLDYKLIQD